jgi:hypothetical protein
LSKGIEGGEMRLERTRSTSLVPQKKTPLEILQ